MTSGAPVDTYRIVLTDPAGQEYEHIVQITPSTNEDWYYDALARDLIGGMRIAAFYAIRNRALRDHADDPIEADRLRLIATRGLHR